MTLIEVLIAFSIIFLVSNLCFVNFDINYYLYENLTDTFYYDLKYIRKQSITEDNGHFIVVEDKSYKLYEDSKLTKEIIFTPNAKIYSPRNIIRFSSDGLLSGGAGTFLVKYKDETSEITVTPASGRLLLKE